MEKKYVKPELAEVEVCGKKDILQNTGGDDASTTTMGAGQGAGEGGNDSKKSIWEYTAE